MEGGDGNDRLISYQGAHFQDHDIMLGGDGDDEFQLFGAQTNDFVDGGEGSDYVQIFLSTTFQTVVAHFDPNGFVVQLNGVNSVFVANCERMFIASGYGNDQITGGALNDLVDDTGGSDTVNLGDGDDYVMFDHTSSSWAADTANGGDGVDRLRWQDQASHYDVYNVDTASARLHAGRRLDGQLHQTSRSSRSPHPGATTP